MSAETVMHLAIGDREHSVKVAQLPPARIDAYDESMGECLLYDVAYRHYTAAFTVLCCVQTLHSSVYCMTLRTDITQ